MNARAVLPIIAVALLGSIPALALGRLLNMDVDEVYSLHATSGTLLAVVQHALYYEGQPPLYFIALSVWRYVSIDPEFARLFSTLCVAAAAVVTGWIGRRYLGTIWGVLLAVAVMFNPLATWAAVETRLYGLVMLLSALLVWFFLEGFALGDKRWARVAYLIVAVAALYTQYYLGFMLAANALTLVAFRRWKPLPAYLGVMLLAALAFSPMLAVLPSQMATVGHSAAAAGTLLNDLRLDVRGVVLTVMPTGFGFDGYLPVSIVPWLPSRQLWIVGVPLVLACAAVALWPGKTRETNGLPTLAALMWSTTLITASIFFLAQHGAHQPWNLRYFSMFVVPLLLSIFATLVGEGERRNPRLALAAYAVLAAASIIANVQMFAPLAKMGDWGRVGAFLQPRVAASQPVIVFEAENALPLSYYYQGSLVPVPRPISMSVWDPRTVVPHSESELSSALALARSPIDTVWLVTGPCYGWLGMDFRCDVLESWVKHNFEVTQTQSFYGSTVRLLRRKSAVGAVGGRL